MSLEFKKICNPQVFERLFNTYAHDLKRFLFFKTHDLDTANDIMQETFIKLWENCDNVNPEKVKSYLFTVANNTFLNLEKHKKVVRKHQSEMVRGIHNSESPEFLMIEEEFLKKIEKTIKELPDKHREVFLLNRIEKKKYREIATMLNISIKTVEKRMHLALIEMKEKVGKV